LLIFWIFNSSSRRALF